MDQHPDPRSGSGGAGAFDWPRPPEGAGVDVAVTHLLIVRDVARSRRCHADVFGAKVLMAGPPSILRFSNTWLVLSGESRPTDDRPDDVAAAPPEARTLVSALNLRVADIQSLYER
jgi:hypothetical protein